MKKILSFLSLGNIGLLEFLFALFPILTGYAYGPIHLGLLTLLIMDIIAITRPSDRIDSSVVKALKWCVAYAVAHEVFLYPFVGLDSPYMHKNIIQLLINVASIFIIAPKLNYQKLLHSLMWVAIAASAGILYQFIQLRAGHPCHPIKLPFMPEMSDESRLYEELRRPSSFFWEPAAYITYMMVPLFLQLNAKKYILAAGLLFFILLSGSTTGIALGFLLVLVYVLTQNVSMKYKVLAVTMGCAMGWFLLSSDLFSVGMDKIDNTQLNENMRIINGPLLVFGMDKWHWIFGVPYENFVDYLMDYPNPNVIIKNGTPFISTLWFIWAKWGLISLALYLYAYYTMIRQCREIIPYVACLLVALFTQGIPYSNTTFFFQMAFILVFINMCHKRHNIQLSPLVFPKECKILT